MRYIEDSKAYKNRAGTKQNDSESSPIITPMVSQPVPSLQNQLTLVVAPASLIVVTANVAIVV